MNEWDSSQHEWIISCIQFESPQFSSPRIRRFSCCAVSESVEDLTLSSFEYTQQSHTTRDALHGQPKEVGKVDIYESKAAHEIFMEILRHFNDVKHWEFESWV